MSRAHGSAVLVLALWSAACSSDDASSKSTSSGGAGGNSGSSGSGGVAGSAGDAGTDATELPPDGTLPPHASSLPFSYTRAEKGTPVTRPRSAK